MLMAYLQNNNVPALYTVLGGDVVGRESSIGCHDKSEKNEAPHCEYLVIKKQENTYLKLL